MEQTSPPTDSAVTFRRGDLTVDVNGLGIKMSTGMSVRIVARANTKVQFADGTQSATLFHSMPDGSAIFPLSTGYVYVSNSEMKKGNGGVYGLYFDHEGNVVDYKILLNGTTRNCSGGVTPWKTWISCEEYGKGQCWQVNPDPNGAFYSSPAMTMLGGVDGGNFESVACDNRNPSQPIFYLTEDHESGALRKYTPPKIDEESASFADYWNMLHVEGGATNYLVFSDANTFEWSSDIEAARRSQNTYYRNVEGIDYYDGELCHCIHFV
jgi:hypothetical protein